MIESGEAVQESDGRISVSKHKPKNQKNSRDAEMKWLAWLDSKLSSFKSVYILCLK